MGVPSAIRGRIETTVMASKHQDSASSDFFDTSSYASLPDAELPNLSFLKAKPTVTAMVYYEGQFQPGQASQAGANQPAADFSTYSASFQIVSYIDDAKAGKDVGKVIFGKPNEIPIYRDLGTALAQSSRLPQLLIFGTPREAAELSPTERRLLLRALGYGINIATSLHQALNEDPEFVAAREKKGAVIQAL